LILEERVKLHAVVKKLQFSAKTFFAHNDIGCQGLSYVTFHACFTSCLDEPSIPQKVGSVKSLSPKKSK
jgi:hypothetical protein